MPAANQSTTGGQPYKAGLKRVRCGGLCLTANRPARRPALCAASCCRSLRGGCCATPYDPARPVRVPPRGGSSSACLRSPAIAALRQQSALSAVRPPLLRLACCRKLGVPRPFRAAMCVRTSRPSTRQTVPVWLLNNGGLPSPKNDVTNRNDFCYALQKSSPFVPKKDVPLPMGFPPIPPSFGNPKSVRESGETHLYYIPAYRLHFVKGD